MSRYVGAGRDESRNDSAYGMIRWKQDQMGFADFGLTYKNPDFVQYAASYGATGHRIAADSELPKVLDKAFGAGGVHLIDLPVDYSLNGPILFDEIPQESAMILPD